MEIHYFWIDNFRKIKGQPITLSSKFIFTTRIDNESKKGKITIRENPNFIENFFEKNNIENVSAIVGKNGAGKTSIFDYILSNYPTGVSSNVQNDALVISTQANTKKFQIIIPLEWEIEIENNTIYSHSIKLYDDSLTFGSNMSNIDFFYYNFFLDYKIDVVNWGGIRNLSTSTLLCLPRKSAIEERWNKHGIDDSEARTYDLIFFIKDEISKAIQLLISDNRKLIPFTPPTELNITISKTDNIHFSNSKINKGNPEINSIITDLLKEFQLLNKKVSIKEQVLNNLYIGIFTNFIVTQFYYTAPNIDYKFDFSFNPSSSIRDFVLSFFKKTALLTTDSKDYGTISNDRFIKLGTIIPKFILTIEKFAKDGVLVCHENYPNLFTLPLTEKTNDNFNHFITLYMQVKGLTNFLEFGWRGLSTGQQSFLSFMSRFNYEKYHSIGNNQINKNLFIMIDEGDAGFHPEWQKQFFKNSLDFLSKIFTDHKVQLVYASNSPYILSDLSKNHITYIDNEENKVSILDKNNSLKETFAQNIHTLLSNSFFLNKGLIGDFAKEKINKIIHLIKKNNPSDDEIEYIKHTIGIIGEPVIKRKLSQLYEDKFDSPINLKEEIEYLEKRLNRLKKTL